MIPGDPQRQTMESTSGQISIVVVLLAAGKASRMGEGGPHKLLAEFDGVPLVRRAAERALASGAGPVSVVTGYRQDEIVAALAGLELGFAYNPDYASGVAGSLITGFSTPEARAADGLLVMLADMPRVTSDSLMLLAAAFRKAGGRAVVRAVSQGRRGNPVILPASLRPAVMRLGGDVGARQIIEASGLAVIDVDIGDAAHLDVDTPEAVIAAGGVLRE